MNKEKEDIKKKEEKEIKEKKEKGFFGNILSSIGNFLKKASIFMLEMTIDLLSLINIIEKININFSHDNLLKFIQRLLEEEKLNKIFKDIKKRIFKIFINNIDKTERLREFLNYLNLDKILISLFYVKYKSGFVCNIKADKLNDSINSFLEIYDKFDDYDEYEESLKNEKVSENISINGEEEIENLIEENE